MSSPPAVLTVVVVPNCVLLMVKVLFPDASQMFSKNVVTLVKHLLKDGALHLDLEDEITRGSLVSRDGQVVHDAVKGKLG